MIVALWAVVAVLALALAAAYLVIVSLRRRVEQIPAEIARAGELLKSAEAEREEALRKELLSAVEAVRNEVLRKVEDETARLDARIGHVAAQATAEGLDTKLNHLTELFDSHMKGFQHA